MTFTPNRRRRRVVDAREEAKEIREAFYDKNVRRSDEMPFTWPSELQDVGRCIAVSYSSDKWKAKKEYEDYKHIAEAPQHLLCPRDFIIDWESGEYIDVVGPWVEMPVPMPKHFARLAKFIGVQVNLYGGWSGRKPRLGRSEDDLLEVRVSRGFLGGARVPEEADFAYPQIGLEPGEPFLFIYTLEENGVHALVTGKKLNIEKDGITG